MTTRKWSRRLRIPAVLILGAGLVWLVWRPYSQTLRIFDTGQNGLWVGHRWYTGIEVSSGQPVTDAELDKLVATVRSYHFRYLYVHAGPVRSDGSIRDRPGPIADRLRAALPDVVLLPWLGSWVSEDTFGDRPWRRQLMRTLVGLRQSGYPGVHLDFEPLRDHHPGYVDLLREIRQNLGDDYFISQASRRAGPFGLAKGPMDLWFWSEGYYRATMAVTDQTVLMGYDTKLPSKKLYAGFMKHETRLLLDWAGEVADHGVLIGIPTYEDAPQTSDPGVENVANAALGIRAGLEESSDLSSFEGVAVYSYWVTDAAEWEDFRKVWLGRSF